MVEFGEAGTLECIKTEPDLITCHSNNNPEDDTGKSSNERKRKLPSWMLTGTEENANVQVDSGESSSSKRSKSLEPEALDTATTLPIKQEPEVSIAYCDKQIKTEENNNEAPDSATTTSIKQEPERSLAYCDKQIKTEENNVEMDTNAPVVKLEPVESDEPTASASNVDNNVNEAPQPVKVEEANNAAGNATNDRPSCRFGIKCYRANPIHRREEAHPGDSDYRRPNFPTPPAGTPDCPFGSACYRRNPTHFRNFAHPPDTNFQQNYINNQVQVQQRLRQQNARHYLFDSDSENDDPFFDGEDGSDYMPTDVEDEGVVTDLDGDE